MLYLSEHPSALFGDKPTPVAINFAAAGASLALCGPGAPARFVHHPGRQLPLTQLEILQGGVSCK